MPLYYNGLDFTFGEFLQTAGTVINAYVNIREINGKQKDGIYIKISTYNKAEDDKLPENLTLTLKNNRFQIDLWCRFELVRARLSTTKKFENTDNTDSIFYEKFAYLFLYVYSVQALFM